MRCDADVLVAGAGPAGLASAIIARRAGFDVVVVDPRPAPRDKACGEGLMPAAVRALATLGVDPPGYPFRGIRYVSGRHSAVAPFRHGIGRGVRRTTLDRCLRDRADELGIPVLPHRVTCVRQTGDAVTVATSRGSVTARWLIGADGLHSSIRAELGLELTTRGPRRWGLRAHYAVPAWTDVVEVHWSAHSEAYVTPVSDDLVGVAVLTGRPAAYAEQLRAFPDLLAHLPPRPVTRVLGSGPLRQRASSRVAGRVLLVGDAAGYIDALTGEGIALSLHAAQAAIECIVAGRPADYDARWLRLSRSYRALTSTLLWAGGRRRLRPVIVPAAQRLPRVFAEAVHVLGS